MSQSIFKVSSEEAKIKHCQKSDIQLNSLMLQASVAKNMKKKIEKIAVVETAGIKWLQREKFYIGNNWSLVDR